MDLDNYICDDCGMYHELCTCDGGLEDLMIELQIKHMDELNGHDEPEYPKFLGDGFVEVKEGVVISEYSYHFNYEGGE